MAEQLETNGTEEAGTDQNLQTLDALHLDGKGAPTLEDADERSLTDSGDTRPEDVTGNANVQSAGRTTYEQMVQGGIREEAVIPTGDHIVVDVAQPTERDNTVAVRFDNVQPTFATIPDLPEPERRPEGPERSPLAPDQLVSPDPLEEPRGDGDSDGVSPANRPAAPVVADGPTEVQVGEDTPEPEPTEEEIITKLADAPGVLAAAASGTEDRDTKLNINIATNDQDGGNESITAITISGVPAGFSFVNSVGVAIGVNNGGVWSFSPADLRDLYLRQPRDYSGDLQLTVSATSTEASSGDKAVTTVSFNVHVEAVANDMPSLAVQNSAGYENTEIPLVISAAATDVDGSETATVYVTGVPAGAVLNHGVKLTRSVTLEDGTTFGAGTWVLRTDELSGLTVTPPKDDSHDFTVQVYAVSTEGMNGDTLVSAPRSIEVDVGVVKPWATGTGTTTEDNWASLDLQAGINAKLGDEGLSVYIEGLDSNVVLARDNAGHSALPAECIETYTDATGTHTRYNVTQFWDPATGKISGLAVSWKTAHTDTDIEFSLRAVVRDGDSDNDAGQTARVAGGGSAAVTDAAPDTNDLVIPVKVVVQAVADAVMPVAPAVTVGVEDKWFSLDINAALVDTDGTETLTLTLHVPDGVTLGIGTKTAPGVWQLSSAQVESLRDPVTHVLKLPMKGALDSDDDFNITIDATVTEAARVEDGQAAVKSETRSTTVTARILSDADIPTISVIDGTQTIDENSFFNLRGQGLLTATDGEAGSAADSGLSKDGSETLTYTLKANSDNTRLWVDTNHDGVAQAGEVTDLAKNQTVTLDRGQILAGDVYVGGGKDWSSNSEVSFDLTATAYDPGTGSDSDPNTTDSILTSPLPRSATASATDTLTLKVRSVVDTADAQLTVTASGFEDGLPGYDHVTPSGAGIAMKPTLVLTDTDGSEQPDGSVVITATNSAMAGGSLYYNGTLIAPQTVNGVTTWTIDNAAWGAATQSGTPGHYSYTRALDGLVFKPAAHEDADPTFSLSVGVVDTSTNTSAAVVQAGTITVEAVADKPTITAEDFKVTETAAAQDISLAGHITGVATPDASETLYVYITGVPAGVSLTGVTVETVTADVVDKNGGAPLLDISAVASGNGTVYRVLASDLAGLKLHLPEGYSKDLTLKTWSVTRDGDDWAVSDGDSVRLDIGVLAPSLRADANVVGVEGTWTQLTGLSAQVVAPDAANSETLSVYIEVPAGVQVSLDGVTPLTATASYVGKDGQTYTGYNVTGRLSDVRVKWTDNHSDADFQVKLRAIVADTDAGDAHYATAITQPHADSADTVVTVDVAVAARADTPNLSASAIGVEDKWAVLNITTSTNDADSESIVGVYVLDLPSTMALNQGEKLTVETTLADGTKLPAGTWVLSANQLSGLKITGLTANSDQDIPLRVWSVSQEAGSGANPTVSGAGIAIAEENVQVKILADADTPTVSVISGTQTINEDQFFNLRDALDNTVDGQLTGNSGEAGSIADSGASKDGSERITYSLKANDDNTRLWVDTNGDGQAQQGEITTLTKGQWVDLQLTDINQGRVHVGGAEDWANSAAKPTVSFDFKTKATDLGDGSDSNASTTDSILASAATQADAGLTRRETAESAPATLTLKINPVSDAGTATLTGAATGYEDGLSGYHHSTPSGAGITVTPTLTLTDADNSEQPSGPTVITATNPAMAGGSLYYNGVLVQPQTVNGVTTWTIDSPNWGSATNNGNGTFTWKLNNLVFKPVEDSADDATYSITVSTRDTDSGVVDTVSATGQKITVIAVADTPDITVNDLAPTAGYHMGMMESASAQSIDLATLINAPTSPENDSSETQYVYISGIPSGASLSGATVTTVTTDLKDAGGTTLLALNSAGGTVYKVLASQLPTLKLNLAAGYSDDIALKVWAVSEEAENQDHAISAPQTVLIDIGVQDPTVTVASTASGTENSWTLLPAATVAVNAADGSETLNVYIDVPQGVQVSLNAGGTVASSVSTFTSGGVTYCRYLIPQADLDNVSVRWAGANSDADFDVVVRAEVVDRDADAAADAGGINRDTPLGQSYADTAVVTKTVHVTIGAEADGPTISVSKAVGVEDQYAVLKLSQGVADNSETAGDTIYVDLPSDSMTLKYFDSATNQWVECAKVGETTLPDGTKVAAGSYAVTPAQAANLRIYDLPADSDADFDITLYATSTEAGDDADGTKEIASAHKTTKVTQKVVIYSDADVPTISIVDGVQTIREDDGFYRLRDGNGTLESGELTANSGEAGSVADSGVSQDGSEKITYSMKANQKSVLWVDKDGDGTVNAGDTYKELAQGETVELSRTDIVGGKVYVRAPENASTSGGADMTFTFTATAKDDDGQNATSALAGTGLSRETVKSSTDTLTLHVDAVVDGISNAAGGIGGGKEDETILFSPKIVLQDNDGSEAVVGDVEIRVLASTLDGEVQHRAADGTWSPLSHTRDGDYVVFKVPASELVYDATAGARVLNTLRYVPTEDSDADLTYRVRATTKDADGSQATVTSQDIVLKVQAVADAPELSVDGGSVFTGTGAGNVAGTVQGQEDSYIDLNLQANRADLDGSETLTGGTLTLVSTSVDGTTNDANVFYGGWSVGYMSGGTWHALSSASPGVWTLTEADMAHIGDVSVRAPLDASYAKTTWSFTAWSEETQPSESGGEQVAVQKATSTVTFDVKVDAVADKGVLVYTQARTQEDTLVKLDIRVEESDIDGSETLSVYVTDVDANAALVNAAGNPIGERGRLDNGVWHADPAGNAWRLTPAEAEGVYYKPAHDSNVDDTLHVILRSTEPNGSYADTDAGELTVNIRGVSDGPSGPDGKLLTAATSDPGTHLHVSVDERAGHQTTIVDPQLGSYGTLDVDGSEALSVVISDIPEGISVFMSDSAFESALKAIGGGKWSVSGEALKYVRFETPTDYAGNFSVKLDFIATENDGDYVKVSQVLDVTVNPKADLPTASLSLANGQGSVNEDSWLVGGVDQGIAFSVAASVTDAGNGANARIGDGSVESVKSVVVDVDVSGFPGARVVYNGVTYTAAAGGHVISIPVTSFGNDSDLTSVSLSGFKLFGVPEDWSKDVPVTLTVTSADGGDTATRTVNTEITLNPIADEPTLTFTGTDGSDADTLPDTRSVTVGGEHYDNVPFFDASSGPVQLTSTYSFNDADGSESTIYFIIKGVPDHVMLSGGFSNGDGTWTVPSSAWPVTLSGSAPADQAGEVALQVYSVVIDRDQDNDGKTHRHVADEPVVVVVNVPAEQPGGQPGNLATGTISGTLEGLEDNTFTLSSLVGNIAITGNGTASALVVDLPDGWRIASGTEGVDYYINAVNGTYTIPVSKVGSVSIRPTEDFAGQAKLGVSVVVRDASGYQTVSADGAANDGLIGTAIPMDVYAVTDGGSISDSNKVINEDTDVALTLTLNSGDDDHSEILTDGVVTIRLSDANAGSLQGAGVSGGNGVFTVQLSQQQKDYFAAHGTLVLGGLTFHPSANYSGTVNLHLSTDAIDDVSTSTDSPDYDSKAQVAALTGDVSITVKAQIDSTTITSHNVGGTEDRTIGLDFSVVHDDIKGVAAHGSEYLSMVVSGVPEGAVILYQNGAGQLVAASNNGGGSWTLPDGAYTVGANGVVTLNNVRILPPEDYAGQFNLTVTTYAMEAGSTVTSSAQSTFTVTVAPDADMPVINPQDVTGVEDAPVKLVMNAGLVDVDGSETLTITIEGVPKNGSFLLGTETTSNGATTVTYDSLNPTVVSTMGEYKTVQLTLSAADFKKLYFQGPENVAGAWRMTASATATDSATYLDGTVHTDTATTQKFTFIVALTAQADGVETLTIADRSADPKYDVVGVEDQPLNLSGVISATMKDTDGSESVTIVISGAPPGARFESGGYLITEGADHTWTISASQLADLKLIAPENANGDYRLTVTAFTTELGYSAHSVETTKTLDIRITPVDDAPDLDLDITGQTVDAASVTAPIHVISPQDTLQISDVDDTTVNGMTIAITSDFDNDTLGLSGVDLILNPNGSLGVAGTGITVSYSHGLLTFSGTGSYDQYAQLAGKVVLTSADGAPLEAGQHTFAITVMGANGLHDGGSTVTANVTLDQDVALNGAALGEVRWPGNGTTVLGETTVYDVNNLTSGSTVHNFDGGTGIDTLSLIFSGAANTDWVFTVDGSGIHGVADNDPHADKSFLVRLDTPAVPHQVDHDNGIVFNGSASGTLEFNDGTAIHFTHLDKLQG